MGIKEKANKIKRLIFGCNALTTNPTSSKANKILRAAISSGIKKFDTAPNYGKGYSELILGEHFQYNAEVYITTKIGGYQTNNIYYHLAYLFH